MNLNWLFIDVEMHYVKKKLTSELWTYFSARSSNFLTTCWLSIFMSTSRQRFQSHASVWIIKTENSNYKF